MPKKRSTGGAPTEAFLASAPGRVRLTRPREPLVELPSLGFPSPGEIRDLREATHQARAEGHGLRIGRENAIRSMTWTRWGEHLTGDDLTEALRAVRYLKHIIRRREEMIVERAIEEDMGWDAIAAPLGISRQAVAQRWGPLADRIWRERMAACAEAGSPDAAASPGRTRAADAAASPGRTRASGAPGASRHEDRPS